MAVHFTLVAPRSMFESATFSGNVLLPIDIADARWRLSDVLAQATSDKTAKATGIAK